MLHRVGYDIRFALRQFAARPGFTATAVLVLALGLGANTAIFSVVNALLLRPLPYPHDERLVTLNERMHGKRGDEGSNLSPANFTDWRAQSSSFDEISASNTGPANLTSETGAFEPERIDVCFCSANFTAMLGVSPIVGRAVRPDEDRYGGSKVALISYNLWQQRLGGAADVVGKSIRLDSDAVQVVGVMPRGFHFPNDSIAVWTPLMSGISQQTQARRDLHFLQTTGRLRAGVTAEQAKAELADIITHIRQEHPGVAMGDGAILTPFREAMVGSVHDALVVLLGAVGCVLLIACVNVANLVLTRSSSRMRELCIRSAIGAGRDEILRQLLTESVLLSLAGGAAGLVLAAFLTPVLTAHVPGNAAGLATGAFGEPRVFLFALAVALAAGLGVGFYPAWRSSRTDVVLGLRDTTRSATASPWQVRFRGAHWLSQK
jgi:putative ABC transport system permease protein